MSQTDDLGNTVAFEKKPRIHKLGKNDYPLDPKVANDPSWYTFEDAHLETKLSVSYIKTISGQLKWPKKYDLVKGVLFTFIEKAVVKEWLASRNPLDFEEKIQEADLKKTPTPNPSENTGGLNKESETLPGGAGENLNPPALNLSPAAVQMINEKVGQLVKATFQEELKSIKDGVDRSRKENTFWKVFAAVTVIVLLGGTTLIVLNFNKINKTILDMTTDLINQKEAVFKSQSIIDQKDFEIKFLQDQINKNASVVNKEAVINNEAK